MGGLLEELSEPAKEMTRRQKAVRGNRGAKSSNFYCICNYAIRNAIQDLEEKHF
jgi:hypothetical protein